VSSVSRCEPARSHETGQIRHTGGGHTREETYRVRTTQRYESRSHGRAECSRRPPKTLITVCVPIIVMSVWFYRLAGQHIEHFRPQISLHAPTALESLDAHRFPQACTKHPQPFDRPKHPLPYMFLCSWQERILRPVIIYVFLGCVPEDLRQAGTLAGQPVRPGGAAVLRATCRRVVLAS
jgi:hypothetical protein